MLSFKKNNWLFKFYTWLPVLLLYLSVLNEFDLNYMDIEYFSFNFPLLLIFYFALKEYGKLEFLNFQ